MPCYQVQTVSVSFHAKNVALIQKAAESLGYKFSHIGSSITLSSAGSIVKIDIQAGKAVAQDQNLVDALKRAYSQQAIKLAAKLGGWQVKNLTSTKGQLLRGVL